MSRIVQLHNQSPLVINKDEMEDDNVFVCRCGLSNDWPYCDGSHAEAADEPEGTVVKYHREDGQLVREDAEETANTDPRA